MSANLCKLLSAFKSHGQSETLQMSDKWPPKDNIGNAKKRASLQLPAFWFTCLVVWIFIIKQVMHFSVIITVLYTSGNLEQCKQ
jgi:hypothetical protein